MRIILVAIALTLLAAAPIEAAPLCRDSKGLFTPCTGERRPALRTHRRPVAQSAPGMPSRAEAAAPVDTADATPMTRAHPSRVGRGKLCRDSKGLFKPC